jgi:hypothetical protein
MQQRQQQELPQPVLLRAGITRISWRISLLPSCEQSGHMQQQLAQQQAGAPGLDVAVSTATKQQQASQR